MKSPTTNGGGNGTARSAALREGALRRVERESGGGPEGAYKRQLLAVLTAFQKGSFDARLPED